MKENCARIVIILDRSGSMNQVREATVSGFNEFIRAQRELPGEVRVKLVQFDDQYEVAFDKPLAEVPELTQDHFVPRGMTALFDAQGKTIVALGEELAALPESERPSKVIVVTLTDGIENASKEYTLDAVASLIKQQTEQYSWDFVFLAANQDAVRTAATMNIPRGSAITYRSDRESSRRAMAAASDYVSASRTTGTAAFSNETRQSVMAEEEDAKRPLPAKPGVSPVVPGVQRA